MIVDIYRIESWRLLAVKSRPDNIISPVCMCKSQKVSAVSMITDLLFSTRRPFNWSRQSCLIFTLLTKLSTLGLFLLFRELTVEGMECGSPPPPRGPSFTSCPNKLAPSSANPKTCIIKVFVRVDSGGLGYPNFHVGSRILHNICKNMEQSAIGGLTSARVGQSHNPVFMKKWPQGGGGGGCSITHSERRGHFILPWKKRAFHSALNDGFTPLVAPVWRATSYSCWILHSYLTLKCMNTLMISLSVRFRVLPLTEVYSYVMNRLS